MFTGLIEDVGKIAEIADIGSGKLISISCNFNLDEIKIGASVAINGACQTVIKKENNILTFEAMKETLKRTNFNLLKKGDFVNLERAMALSDRLDGHLVSGHVDETASLIDIKDDNLAKIFKFMCKTDLIVEKGSIAINGISLTISNVDDETFEVSILPYTLNNTNLKYLKQNALVNIEYDMVAKYVKKFTLPEKKSKITREFLIENGF